MTYQENNSARLPCLGSISSILNPDKDTNFLSDLMPNQAITYNFVTEFLKVSHLRLEKDFPMFKSVKEIEWATEIIGCAFLPPHFRYSNGAKNYLKYALTIYEFLLFNELEITDDGKSTIKGTNNKQILEYEDYSHQKVMLKMLTHLTLLFEERNFDMKPNPLVGDPRLRAEEMKVPFKLCALILKIYRKFVFKAHSYLASDHWEYIIRLLLGLATHILQGVSTLKEKPKIMFPIQMNIAIIELLYNSWILSGLQNEEIWTLFKNHIQMLINHHDGIVSYWSDICFELTAKILINSKCFDQPELIIQEGNSKQIRCNNEDLLIINHNYRARRNDLPPKIKFSIFTQPFIFDLSPDKVQYLWSRMITLMNNVSASITPISSLLISRSIKNVIMLFLKLGSHCKPEEETFEFSQMEGDIYEYNIENKRKIVIKHSFSYFEKALEEMTIFNIYKVLVERFLGNLGQVQNENEDNKKEHNWIVSSGERPSKNSLLELFGKLLFENATDTRPEYKETRLEAICILCMIFTKAKGPFYEETLKKFYKVYLEYLESLTSWDDLQTLLEFSTELFLVDCLPYNTVLLKPLLIKLQEFYKKPKGDKALQGKFALRDSCNKIFSSLLCSDNDESELFPELLELAFLKDREEFPASITSKKDAEVQILARSLWNLMIYSILNNRIVLFVKKLSGESGFLKESSPVLLNELGIQAFLVLGEMYLGKLDELGSEWNEVFEDILESGQMIVEMVCKFIEVCKKALENCNSKNLQIDVKEEHISTVKTMISKAFGILYIWFLILSRLKEADQKSQKSQIFSQVFQQVFNTLEIWKNIKQFSESIKSLRSCIFNLFGDSNFHKNILLENSILFQNGHQQMTIQNIKNLEDQHLLSIGLHEDTILSFYRLQTEQALLLVIRNSTGKFIWSGELKSKLIGHTETILVEPSDVLPSKGPLISQENTSRSSVMCDRVTDWDGSDQELGVLLQQQIDIENEYEEIYNQNNKESQSLHEEEDQGISDMSAIRMFLVNAGILSPSDWENLTYIPFDNSSKQLFRKIDQSPAKCQIFASLFYVKQPTCEKIEEFPRSDILFQNFIESLGTIIDDQKMKFGDDELPKRLGSEGKPILYASNPLYEIIFALPNLSASELTNSSEPLYTPPVILIWNVKAFAPYETPSYPRLINRLNLKDSQSVIIITPLNEDSFHLNVLKKDNDFMVFPQVENFVCSAKMVASVVFQTIISLYQEYQLDFVNTPYLEAMLGKIFYREVHISHLIRTYKGKDDNIHELLSKLFN